MSRLPHLTQDEVDMILGGLDSKLQSDLEGEEREAALSALISKLRAAGWHYHFEEERYGVAPARPACDPQVLRALRAELHQHRGGHQGEVQADVGSLGTVAARTLLLTLRELRSSNQTMKSQPWRAQ